MPLLDIGRSEGSRFNEGIMELTGPVDARDSVGGEACRYLWSSLRTRSRERFAIVFAERCFVTAVPIDFERDNCEDRL